MKTMFGLFLLQLPLYLGKFTTADLAYDQQQQSQQQQQQQQLQHEPQHITTNNNLIFEGNNNSNNKVNGIRNLQDFDRFNELFEDAKIVIPDNFEVSQRVALVTLTLYIRHIECYDMTIGDISIDYDRRSSQEIDVDVRVRQLDLVCDIDYRYDYGLLRGSGEARVTTNDNSMSTVLDFRSSNWNTSPPRESNVQSCNTNIEITNMEFFGDFVSNIVEIFEGLLRGVIEREIEKLACDELGSLGTSFVTDMLDIAGDALEGYTGDLGVAVTDPLHMERTANLPSDLTALDLQDTSTLIGGWFQQALAQIDTLLGATVPDPDGGSDLGINVLLRQNLLDSNRALTVEISDIPGLNPVLFQGHDRLMETTVRMDRVQVLGLDSFTQFESIQTIGKQTLQTSMTWERLEVEFAVTVEMKPSSFDNAIIQDSTSTGISESVIINFSVDTVDVLAALYLVIDEDALGDMQIGPLLHTGNLLSCLLSVIHTAELSGLSVDPQTVNYPTLSGFVSPGIDRIVTGAVETAFAMYEGVLGLAIPNIFQTAVRDFVNEQVLAPFQDDNADDCPSVVSTPGFVDFRDLLLAPYLAGFMGGTGTEPYGDLAHMAMQLVDSYLLSSDSNGLLDLNDFLIKPITESISGRSGAIDVPGELIKLVKTRFANDYIRSFVNRFEIGLENLRIENLDIIKEPTFILDAQPDGPHFLSNKLTMGPVPDRPLNISLGFNLLLEGPGANPLHMDNQIDVSVSFPSAVVEADVIAMIATDAFLQFPLQDILVPDCWLATIPAPAMDELGNRLLGAIDTLALQHFDLDLSALNLNVNVLSTNSPGLAIISDLLTVFQSTGAGALLLSRVEQFLEEVITSDWTQFKVDQALLLAPKFCPSRPEYDPDFPRNPDIPGQLPFPALSRSTIDTLLFGGGVVAEVGFMIFVERHSALEPSNALLAQEAHVYEPVLDWTNLEETDLGSLIDVVIDALGRYMGSPLDGSDVLGVNSLIQDYLFDGKDEYRIDFESVSFRLPGIKFEITTLAVKGLDSFTKFDIFDPIAPQTVNNTMHMEQLAIEVEMQVLHDDEEEPQAFKVSFSMRDIEVSMALFIALDQNKVEALEVGSLMNTTNILPCLLSTVHSIDITQLHVAPAIFDDPQIDGLFGSTSESLDTFTTALLALYRDQIIDTMPKIFDHTVRNLVNGLVTAYLADPACAPPKSDFESTFIDFRKLFDDEDDTYGELPGVLRNLLDTELLRDDPATGKPLINEALIVPYTLGQSGIEGELSFPRDVFTFRAEDIPQFGIETMNIKAATPRIRNLDTIASPIELLSPNATNGQLLHNLVTVGTSAEPFQFSLKGLVSLTGDPALEMDNEIEVSVNLVETELIASLLAKVNAANLFQFQLGEIGNADCWLAALVGTLIDEQGALAPDGETGLLLESILLSISSIRFGMECLDCSSPGLEIMPEVLETLDNAGVAETLERRVVDLGLDLVRSDYFQHYVNNLLVDGSLRCPHSPTFENANATSQYPVPSLPALSYDSLETVAFAVTVFMHMAAVVVAESHEQYDTNSTDPLSGQKQLEIDLDPEIRLVNFTSLDTSLGEWIDVAFQQLLEYLSASVGNDLRVNDLLRSTLLDDDGTITFDFDDVAVGGEELEVSLKRMRVTGLDTISSINVLDAIGPQTLRNELTWDRLGLEVVISLMASEEESGSGRLLQPREDITVNLGLVNVDVSLAMLLAMDIDLLGSLEMGQVLEIKNILPCLLSAAQAASLTELEVAVGSISDFSVIGFRSAELNSAAADSSRVLLDKYEPLILSSMPGVFDSTVRALLNNWIDYKMVDWTNTSCPKSTFEFVGQGFLDFRDFLLSGAKSRLLGGSGTSPYGDLFSTAYGLVQDLLFKTDPDTGMSAANDALLGPITRSQSNETGSIVFPGEVISGGTRLNVGGLDANVVFRASDFRIDNVDTVGEPLAVLEPANGEAHLLNNTATFGGNDRHLHFGIRLFILIGDDNEEIRNEVDVSLDLDSANVLLGAMLKIAETRFYSFPLRDALDYNCWMATVPAPTLDARGIRVEGEDPTVSMKELAASISRVNLNMTCVDCTSPRMSELTELLSSSDAQDAATDLSNQLLDYATELMGGTYLQVQVDRMLNDAARNCPHRPEYEFEANEVEYQPFEVPETEYSVTFLALLGGVAVGLVLVVGFVGLCVRCFVQRRHRKWLSTLPPQQVRLLALRQDKEDERESDICNRTTSMFTSPDIHVFVRWFMPVALVGNIALFLSGHLSLGATVNIEAQLAGQTFSASNFFEFSMAKSTVDIWNAGGKELAVLILVFSGVWPYTKTLMTLALWFIPPTKVSVSKRGSILLWLDWLAKWSMIDIFVLVISLVAFRISVQSPETGILPPDFYSVDLLVVPLWGLYANMIAQLVSQVSSHFIIYYHRRIVNVATSHQEQSTVRDGNDDTDVVVEGQEYNDAQSISSSTDQPKNRLCEQAFVRPHRGETDKLVTFRWVNKAVGVVVVCLVVLVVLGCTLPSFSLEILGMVGVAVESGQGFEQAKNYHSVFTVIRLLLEQAAFLGSTGDYIGLGTLSTLFAFSVLIVPIAQALVLLYQWFAKTTNETRAKISILAEVLQAWQYAEVYLIAIFVASWQLGPISEFMINSYCDSLRDTFAQLVYYGLLNEEDAQCFSVRSSIESGSYILAGGAVLLAFVNSVVTKAVFQYFRDQAESNEEDVDAELVGDVEADDSEGTTDHAIRPVPVLFTDTFRWLLRRADNIQPEPHAVLTDLVKDDGVASYSTEGEQNRTLGLDESSLVEVELLESRADESSHRSRSARVLADGSIADSEEATISEKLTL